MKLGMSSKRHLAAVVAATALSVPPAVAQVPSFDHVIVIVLENHSYDEVRVQPFTASLISTSSACVGSYGVARPSQPNYLALWAGSTFGVADNNCPAPGSPFSAENLGHACETMGLEWRAYCEDLPSPGSTTCSSSGYRRKHAPWTNFSNLDHANERPFSDLAADLATGNLPALAFVVPNNCNSTHDCSVATGDAWLAAHVPPMLAALGSRGLLILTWDEDDGSDGNHILTVFAGPKVKPGGAYTETVTHYTVLRTICDALGLPPIGGAASALPVDDIWIGTTRVAHATWGQVKALYR